MSAVSKETKAPKRVLTLGSIIDGLYGKREQKRALEAQIKEIEASITIDEATLMERMDAEGIDKSTGKLACVSVSSNVTASISDWDEFTKYVAKTKYFHLIQRRVSDVACRELFESKGKIPGLEPFTKRKINLRVV